MTGDLITAAQNTWCPGCGNFSIQHKLKDVILGLVKDGTPLEEIVLVTGIGCHAKMADYLDINSFYSIHGRTLPVATAIKLARPELTVICCAGDGDCYAEGLDHLIFAAKRNIDVTLIVHNNRVYGLTTGQYTPTSPLGFHGRSTPQGTKELPFNPLELMLASGAGFVARGYTRRLPGLQEILDAGVRYKGFAFIDVLQICATYFNMSAQYDKLVYDLTDHDAGDFDTALRRSREWDYNTDAPIGLGVFFEKEMPTFSDRFAPPMAEAGDREDKIRDLLDSRV
jgi:2-oxoglutarate ferredoxin oxidoreductase subunit beta